MLPDIVPSTIDYMKSGGGVIIPMIAVSVWMWALILMKLTEFRRWRAVEKPVRECLVKQEKPGFEAAPWQLDIMARFAVFREAGIPPGKKELLRIQRIHENAIGRHVKTILILAAVAPLLGLLGTVAGMIKTFDIIALFGNADSKAMASGISEALITTQTGLIVSVPGLVLGNFIHRRSEWIKVRMNRFCLGLLREIQHPSGE
ncbi:hypothetical protein JCM14469_09420 [Desulfatiferula olefinivorans]